MQFQNFENFKMAAKWTIFHSQFNVSGARSHKLFIGIFLTSGDFGLHLWKMHIILKNIIMATSELTNSIYKYGTIPYGPWLLIDNERAIILLFLKLLKRNIYLLKIFLIWIIGLYWPLACICIHTSYVNKGHIYHMCKRFRPYYIYCISNGLLYEI